MTRRGCALLLFSVCLALVGAAAAQPEADEYTQKAANIRQIGTYVTWPANFAPGGPDTFVIGVLGKVPFPKEALDRLARLTVRDKKIVLRYFDTLTDVRPCHVLFLAPEPAEREGRRTAAQRLADARARLNGAPTLLVADQEGLGRKGAMINFFLENDRVRFEINPGAARQAGLAISADLLEIGKIVTTEKD